MPKQIISKNGLRLVHEPVKARTAHCCVIIKIGSRDENKGEEGFAHFTEHALFKGTQKRKTFHILSRLDDVGGELNAYTTKEYTCIHATFLSEYYERVIELFSDILFNSTFPEREIEREKDVILDELLSYQDSPSDAIFDEFEELMYQNHSLGLNILGSKLSIKSVKSKKLIHFVDKHYHPDNMIISSVGNISTKKVNQLVDKYFSPFSQHSAVIKRTKPVLELKKRQAKKKAVNQLHSIIGWYAYPYGHEKSFVLDLLSSYLGGNSLNAKLYLEIREKKGLAYTVESNLSSFCDTALFSIYFGTDVKNNEKIMDLIHKEILKLQTKTLGTIQLARIKRQLEGQLAIAMEYNEAQMTYNAKEWLYLNEIESQEQIFEKIRSIEANEIMEVANEIFDWENYSALLYMPK